MASKSNPEKNSQIIKRYIDKYADKKHYKHETIYTIDSDEVAYICDFLDSKKSKVFLCFYNFSADSYDKKSIYDIFQFTEGNVMFPYDRINMTDDGLELGINICVPARDGVVDPALLNEVLSHELRHVYRLYKEYMAGHISHPQKSKREKNRQ